MVIRWLLIFAASAFFNCSPTHSQNHNPDIAVNNFINLNTADKSKLECPDSTLVETFFLINYVLFKGVVYDSDITARFDNRDDHIFKESCFEIFFDPKSDGENYYELQINAKGTLYDKIIKRSDGFSDAENVVEWTIDETLVKTEIQGTLNDNSDTDQYWTFEIKIPYTLINEGKPSAGDIWSINFMRVDFHNDTPTHWVWMTTGKNRNIHVPEKWQIHKF